MQNTDTTNRCDFAWLIKFSPLRPGKFCWCDLVDLEEDGDTLCLIIEAVVDTRYGSEQLTLLVCTEEGKLHTVPLSTISENAPAFSLDVEAAEQNAFLTAGLRLANEQLKLAEELSENHLSCARRLQGDLNTINKKLGNTDEVSESWLKQFAD